jgi:phosphate transport system substrate-binding protein
MKRHPYRVLLALTAMLALFATACGSSGSSSTTSGVTTPTKAGETTTTEAKLAAATLKSSGSTFQTQFIQAVAASFQSVQPNVQVPYASGGSGQGQTDLQGKLVDFAGSDGLPKPADLSKYTGGALLYFPDVAAPITVSYNVSGVSNLKLDADTIAKIFEGKITTWDDAAIKALNSGVSLPSSKITPEVRSDGSGTTQNFSKYLVAAAPSTWTLGSDKTIAWPSGAVANKGSAAVAAAIKSTTGSIGYVDLADAVTTSLTTASIKNASGAFVAPTIEGAAAAVAGATLGADLSYNPINTSGAKAYPITSPTWILVYKMQTDPTVAAALKSWLKYVLTVGQTIAPTKNYAALPASFVAKALAQVDEITG